MIRRVICAMMLCIMIFAFAGCGNTASGNYTDSVQEQTGTEEETSRKNDDMIIRITAGDHVITATFYDNAAGKALWDKLPLTLPMMNLYGREMCYRFGAGGLPEHDAEDMGYEIGDISYWPPAGSLVILYKQNGEVFEQQPIGHTDDDISFFDGMPDTDIIFEKVDKSEPEKRMIMKIGETEVPVTWEENASVDELETLLPLTIQMSMYGGFEQVGSVGQNITCDDVRITTEAGDIVLYSGNQIVVFYGSNSWSYSRLGHVDLSQGDMEKLLSNGDVEITLSAE